MCVFYIGGSGGAVIRWLYFWWMDATIVQYMNNVVYPEN